MRSLQRPVAAADAFCCWASWLERPVQRPVTSVCLFLRDLASGLVPILMLGLCLISWVFSCASKILLMVLIITSPLSKSCLASYWTTKQSLANSLVQFGCVDHQTPKSKVNGPRVHFPYNLPLFGDWWQHDQSKQLIKILNLKNYLLARMQYKGQGYMMLRDTTWKTMIPIEDLTCPCKCPHVALWIKVLLPINSPYYLN